MAGLFKQSKRKSFFAEQRESNSNPNFINTMDYSFLRSSVKRIIKDAAENIIITDDYIYLKNNNVINACIQESWEEWMSNKTLRLALQNYINMALPNKWVTPDVDLVTEYTTANNELAKAVNRETIWCTAFNIFKSIEQGADPIQAMINFTRFNKQCIKAL